jgi:hypothetical protein
VQQLALRAVRGEREGAVDGLDRLGPPVEPVEQLGPGGVEQVVAVELERVDQGRPAPGPSRSATAMARLRATTGEGVSASSWS